MALLTEMGEDGEPPGGVITTAKPSSAGLPLAEVVMKMCPSGCEQFSEEIEKSVAAARTRKTARPPRHTTSSRAMAADRRFFMAQATPLTLSAEAPGPARTGSACRPVGDPPRGRNECTCYRITPSTAWCRHAI